MPYYGIPQLVASMRVVRENTIQIAEDIPESEYNRRVSPDTRSVAELLVHIAWLGAASRFLHDEQRIAAFDRAHLASLVTMTGAEEKRTRSKAEIIDMLRSEGERSVQWIEQLPEAFLLERVTFPGGGSQTRFEMLMGAKEHEMQHRAQLAVVQRVIGIVPHFTRNLHAALAT